MQENELRIADPVSPLVPAVAGTNVSWTALTHKCEARVDIPALNALALRSLTSLYESSKNLFVRCASWSTSGLHRQQTSPRRTAIALLGLQKLDEVGCSLPFDLMAIQEAVLADTSWVSSVADLGLLTWVTAAVFPDKLGKLFLQFDFDNAIDSYPDGRKACTRALAWFLAGLSQARLVEPSYGPDLTDTAANAYHLLLENQGESGLFGHAAFPGLLGGFCSKRFGTFSDQIYAIYGLAAFSKAFQVEEPLESALRAANSIRMLQGEMGEWWFLYNKRTTRVITQYPVYCCHQDGTAPMGLIALEEATGQCFREAIGRGLSWIAGTNALQNDLRSLDRGLIWDSIRMRHRRVNCWEPMLHLLHARPVAGTDDLGICQEARPDHYGWLLYALGKAGLHNIDPKDG
jgi:hypothetical protein